MVTPMSKKRLLIICGAIAAVIAIMHIFPNVGFSICSSLYIGYMFFWVVIPENSKYKQKAYWINKLNNLKFWRRKSYPPNINDIVAEDYRRCYLKSDK